MKGNTFPFREIPTAHIPVDEKQGKDTCKNSPKEMIYVNVIFFSMGAYAYLESMVVLGKLALRKFWASAVG